MLKKIALCFVACICIYKGFAQNNSKYILDMVHNNPGEPLTNTVFNDPKYLVNNQFTGQVINDFTFAHAAITFDELNPQIFPKGSKERLWVENSANKIRENINKAHKAGIKVYYFTDIIVLPKKLVDIYRSEICDEKGKISFERPKTIEIHRIMLNELFNTFPDLDGLVIRTGETYLNNVPYHTGNGPITNGEESHVKLINLLREEVCVNRNKKIFYRTWSFGGIHEDPKYYANVTNRIKPNENLVFSIKHTKGDYHRTFDFNPTLGIGKHGQIVEVQCQREYEGKGAYPNYVMDGVINGFEEFSLNSPQVGNKSLNDIKNNPNFKGIWSWSRGGGWVGPYINNEFWCKLNAYVIGHWGVNTKQSELEIFNQFMDENGIEGESRKKFRELCLLSAKAVLRGHDSANLPFDDEWVWWMRDEFLSGISPTDTTSTTITSEGQLHQAFTQWYHKGLLQKAIAEKYEAVEIWKKISVLSDAIVLKNKEDEHYIRTSSQYGLLLHQIIAEGWNIMGLGYIGDRTGNYDKVSLASSIAKYDDYWKKYENLKQSYSDCATLYKPYAFIYIGPNYHKNKGMDASVNLYRDLIKNSNK